MTAMREDMNSDLRPDATAPAVGAAGHSARILPCPTEPAHGESTAPASFERSSLWITEKHKATARLRELHALLHRTDALGSHLWNREIAALMRLSEAQIDTGIRWLGKLKMAFPTRKGARVVRPAGGSKDFSRAGNSYVMMEDFGKFVRHWCEEGDDRMAAIFAAKRLAPYDNTPEPARRRPFGGPTW